MTEASARKFYVGEFGITQSGYADAKLLVERLRILAADLRLDSLPKKFRMTMNAAADEIERRLAGIDESQR